MESDVKIFDAQKFTRVGMEFDTSEELEERLSQSEYIERVRFCNLNQHFEVFDLNGHNYHGWYIPDQV